MHPPLLSPLRFRRQVLWVRVSQASYRAISVDVLSHILHMDLAFHLTRKTGELTKIMDRGTSSIQDLLSVLVFSVGPSLADILIACIYIAGALQARPERPAAQWTISPIE